MRSFVKKCFIHFLFILFALNALVHAQVYEINFDSINAYGWFGGDDRPGQQRNVAAAQSVFIESPISLESFAFYFSTPFDSITVGLVISYEVTLKLHIRDSAGNILKEQTVIVPDSLISGWVTWQDINLNLSAPGKYIFSCYLVGGYDSIKVHSSQGCDLKANYPEGELYIKYVSSDSDAAVWGDWSLHTWDAAFHLKGTVLTTDIKDDKQPSKEFYLAQNYPNPFNPSTKIKFTIPGNVPSSSHEGKKVVLKVFNILGEEAAVLINEIKSSGIYETEFNASGLSSGLYIYRLSAGGLNISKKMIYLK